MKRIFSGSKFEADIGYARAVVDDRYVHVAGTTGYNYEDMTISDDVVQQAEQCLQNIGKVLAEAGCSFEDVVRVHYIFPDGDDFEPCWPVFKKYFGAAPPAATMIIAKLLDEAMRLEIEVTARLNS